jgi:hypothetical protein
MNAFGKPAATRVSLEVRGLSPRHGAGDNDVDNDATDDDAIRESEAEPLEDDHYPGNDEYEEIEEDEL